MKINKKLRIKVCKAKIKELTKLKLQNEKYAAWSGGGYEEYKQICIWEDILEQLQSE